MKVCAGLLSPERLARCLAPAAQADLPRELAACSAEQEPPALCSQQLAPAAKAASSRGALPFKAQPLGRAWAQLWRGLQCSKHLSGALLPAQAFSSPGLCPPHPTKRKLLWELLLFQRTAGEGFTGVSLCDPGC